MMLDYNSRTWGSSSEHLILIYVKSNDIDQDIWASMQENLSLMFANNKGSDQSVEPHRRHCVVVLEQDTFILA